MTEKELQKKRESMPEIHRRFADLIREGKQQATLMSDFMSVLGISDRRQAYQIVEELINRYYYPIGASKIKKMNNTIRNFRNCKSELERAGSA